MKILFLARRFYPDIGGVEKHVEEISKILVQKGHRITILTESPLGQSKEFIYKNIRIVRFSSGKNGRLKKFRIWKELWKKRQVFKDTDVIHCHDVFFWYLPFRFLFPFKPVYTTFHGYEGYPILKKAILIRKLSEIMSWGNICIGDFMKKWYGTKPTLISYGATEIQDSRFKIQDVRKNSAVFIGRLDEQTGILTYAKAVKNVQKKIPGFEFLIVGDGPLLQQTKRICHSRENGNPGMYKFEGFQKNPDKYFQKYHFAFVSRYLSILEAMAAKRLIFAVYDNPVKEDYLRMSPFSKWIILVGSEKELEEKILYYLKHPEKEILFIEQAYAWVKAQTWQKLSIEYLKLWKIASLQK